MLVPILNLIYREFLQERPFGHGNPGGQAMTEVVTALLVFFSFSVFLAHAFDAYRVR